MYEFAINTNYKSICCFRYLKYILSCALITLFAFFAWPLAAEDSSEIARLREVAEKGGEEDEFNLGQAYHLGEIVKRDDSEALKWWLKAAAKGNPDAQFSVATAYSFGYGTVKSDSQAVQWALKAADQNYIEAQSALGLYYLMGWGVPQDNVASYMWFTIVTQNNETKNLVPKRAAESALAGLNKSLSPQKITEAQNRANKWIKQHLYSDDERKNIISQIKKCWSFPKTGENATISDAELELTLARDGRILSAELASNRGHYISDPRFHELVDSAIESVTHCTPLKNLPGNKYNYWRKTKVNFVLEKVSSK